MDLHGAIPDGTEVVAFHHFIIWMKISMAFAATEVRLVENVRANDNPDFSSLLVLGVEVIRDASVCGHR